MTTTHTHTPGPWTVDKWHYEHRGEKLVIKTAHDAICEVHSLWCPDDRAAEQQANAALIAAAPTMLSALYDARQALLHLPITPGGIAHIAQMHIDEAIAKATGE